MWSRGAQEYEAKINSGNIVAISEVVRDLFRPRASPSSPTANASFTKRRSTGCRARFQRSSGSPRPKLSRKSRRRSPRVRDAARAPRAKRRDRGRSGVSRSSDIHETGKAWRKSAFFMPSIVSCRRSEPVIPSNETGGLPSSLRRSDHAGPRGSPPRDACGRRRLRRHWWLVKAEALELVGSGASEWRGRRTSTDPARRALCAGRVL